MRALLLALILAAAAPAIARAYVLPEPGEVPPQSSPRSEPAKSGCSRRAGGPASDGLALLIAGAFSLLFLAGQRKLRA